MTQLGFEEQIAPELRDYAVAIDTVQPHPDNARTHRLDRIMQSLESHGQRALIVVQASTGFIVKGNGTWRAAKQLGWERIAAIKQDLHDDAALAFLLADNKASDDSGYDPAKLKAGLSKLVGGEWMQSTLFSGDDFADLEESLMPGAVIAPETGAAYTHELAGEKGEEVQGKREAGAQSEQERLKDVRFPLTLSDHAVFVERLKLLQKRYGTAGAIATIIETVKRQAEAEGSGPVATGRKADAALTEALTRNIVDQVWGAITTIGMDPLPRSVVRGILGGIAGELTDPEPPAQVPGQTEAFPEEINPYDAVIAEGLQGIAEGLDAMATEVAQPQVLDPEAVDSADER